MRRLMRAATVVAFSSIAAISSSGCIPTRSPSPAEKAESAAARDPLLDDNAGKRAAALAEIERGWRAAIASGGGTQAEFVDANVGRLTRAYVARRDGARARDMLEILAEMHDARCKPALVRALEAYVAGKNDVEAELALRAIVFMRNDFVEDAEVGRALLTALEAVRASSERVAGGIEEVVANTRPRILREGFLALVAQPNDGDPDLALRQVVAAHGLARVGDVYMVEQLVDAFFVQASRNNAVTPEVVGALAQTLASFGRTTVAVLTPYLRQDPKNPKVLHVAALGNAGDWYVAGVADVIATTGLPDVAGDVKGIVDGLGSTPADDARARMLANLLGALPGTPAVRFAFDALIEKAKGATKVLAVEALAGTMEPDALEALLAIAAAPKVDRETREAALGGALRIASTGELATVLTRFDATTRGRIDALAGAPFVDEIAIDRALLERCGSDGGCYVDACLEASATFGKEKALAAEARIRIEKSLFMVAAFGKDADLSALVAHLGEIPDDMRALAVRALADAQATRRGDDALVRVLEETMAHADAGTERLAVLAIQLRLRNAAP